MDGEDKQDDATIWKLDLRRVVEPAHIAFIASLPAIIPHSSSAAHTTGHRAKRQQYSVLFKRPSVDEPQVQH
jgi:hypothetical protein